MKKDVHIGELIKEKLKESHLSIAEFANTIHKTRPTIYDIFSRKSIDIDLLIDISNALHFDFMAYAYYDNTDLNSKDSNNRYLIVKVIEECDLEKESPFLFLHKIESNE